MVGRTAELQVLLHAAERATSGGGPQLVTVFGPAGVGKSRLLREFLQRVGEGTTALRGRCLPYGDGITFWPLAEIVRAACSIGADESLSQARGKVDALMGDARDVAERVSAAIGLSDTAFPVEETFWATRRFLEISSGDRPTIVLIDDIHWAEDTFLDLVRYVVDTAEAPLVLVCSSRPDLLEEHAEWVQERERVRRVLLEPLSDEESTTVVENLLGTAFPDEGIRNRIIHAAGGNPLFVEQMLSMLTDEGVLLRTGEGDWILTCDPGTLTVPPSISALLTARLDRLGDAERAVIQRGAVIGQIFFRGAVEDLSPEEVRPYVDPSLRTLQTKELIRPNNSTFAGQDAFRFLHILIRDAAYQALLKRTRAELHERFVDWLERLGSDRLMEYEEIHGYHLEQAFLIRSELGTIDEHTTAIGRRGAAHLSSAGHRTLARGDMPAASSLLERASALLAPGDPERSRLLLDAAGAMIEAGEFARADEVLAHATEEAAARGDASVRATARVMRLRSRYTTNAPEVEGTLADELQRDLLVLEGLDDHAGLAQAWRLLTQVHATNGMYGKAEEAALQMIEHARLAGNPLMGTRHLNALAFCALYGPTPVPKAIRRCEDVLEQARGDRKAEAVTRCALAHLHAMRGDFDVARDLYRQSRATLQELGWKLHAATTSIDSGSVEMLAGDPVAAEAELRPDYEALQRMGDRNYSYTTAAFLAEALYLQGRLDEADGVTRDVEREAAEDDVTPQVLWRSVRAKILARKGMHVEAEELAREAVRLILQGDEPDAQGNALADLAEVLAAAGRRDEADAALADAIRRFEEKGNVVSARRARALVDV
jgi:tetratricopeptide (TPR) repeat protein